jgi:dihydroneopterin aldolase
MGIIKLKNIRTYSYHGCLIEEGKIGSEYSVDLEIKADLEESALTDDLQDTVDYVHLNRIVVEEMAIRSNLLEHVAQRIIKRIFNEIEAISRVKLGVSKLNPPIGGDVEAVTIEMKEYRK